MAEKRAKSKKMKEVPSQEPDTAPDKDDSIEILEIVGLDEGKGKSGDRPKPGAGVSSPPEPPDSIPYSRQQLYDMLLRKQAEFENSRKRMERDREESQRRNWMDLLGCLLPVLDNFQRALAESPSEPSGALRQGVLLTFQQMMDILHREGLEGILSVGEPFDPHVHEAVETRVVEGMEEGVVLEELRKGYRFRGHLLRPALVRVSAKGESPLVGEA
jgi:molecular chaperone GrpE